MKLLAKIDVNGLCTASTAAARANMKLAQRDLVRPWVENRRLIAAAVKTGFTVNLSADNPGHTDRLAEPGIAPVVTVLARAYARKALRHRFKRRRDEWAETIGKWRDRTASLPRSTPAGTRIAICSATYSDATCKTCRACARVRDAAIGRGGD